MANVAE